MGKNPQPLKALSYFEKSKADLFFPEAEGSVVHLKNLMSRQKVLYFVCILCHNLFAFSMHLKTEEINLEEMNFC